MSEVIANADLVGRIMEMVQWAVDKDMGIQKGAFGLVIRNGHYAVGSYGHVCALGACMHGKAVTGGSVPDSFAKEYGVTDTWAWEFAYGFDNPTNPYGYTVTEAVLTGAEVRRLCDERGIEIKGSRDVKDKED